MRPAAVEAQGGSSPAPSPELTSQCASCHALTRPADTTVEHLWNRKGPDLWYAGDKFNREWLVGWLQNPTTIRPGGVMWFKHAKAGDPHDTIDTAAVEKHPKVDAATAEKLADALLRSEEHTSELQSLMRISSAGFSLKQKYTKVDNRHYILPIIKE